LHVNRIPPKVPDPLTPLIPLIVPSREHRSRGYGADFVGIALGDMGVVVCGGFNSVGAETQA
jgi:hypothetical protein